ncbi:MAG: LLM class F420-dependent oxidoreductase [Chloroflexi bacterium]|nr:LLM class F420-dependent oxidoreductase [Anaerolineaceae bacterium]NMB87111.1 LLM class F420-dependent oxidoreductase [Chloroflexota bacterium]
MTNIRVGVLVQPQHTTWPAYAAAVQRVEALGVDTIWTWDHFFPCWGDPEGSSFEGWSLLTAMAVLTRRAEVGCMVTCNSYRNPNLLADMARTVDHISAGRLILGIGAGWFERDYQAYGYAFEPPAGRLKALEENLATIRGRWPLLVPPPTRPIPVLVGGGGEKVTLRLVARYADIWNGFGPAEEYGRKNQILDAWCRQIGRDPDEIERSITVDVQDVPAGLDESRAAGATHLVMRMGDPWDFTQVERLVAWREQQNQ